MDKETTTTPKPATRGQEEPQKGPQMERKIYIEPETIRAAEENSQRENAAALDTIRNGSPEEIREAVQRAVEASQNLRAFICANYGLRYR